MTWIQEKNGYQLFFNRDELRTRQVARPPEVHRSGQLEFIAPSDSDHGGTWITVNRAGLALCLLNGYRDSDADPATADVARISRGLLVTSLADARSPSEVVERTRAAHLERFRSFRLAAFHPSLPPRFARWQSNILEAGLLAASAMPIVSSSYAPEDVAESRRALFLQTAGSGGDDSFAAHTEFHRSHSGRTGAHSVCMHREDAKTVSFSRISVDANRVQFFYAPHSPHEGTPESSPWTLDRI